MIRPFEYTPKEVDFIYSEIENAVNSHSAINMEKISTFIKPGDFYLFGSGANGLLFSFNGLKWVEDGRIYNCLIQPQIRHGNILPEWYPVITTDDRELSSSGILHMIKKENRYIPERITKSGWVDRTLKT